MDYEKSYYDGLSFPTHQLRKKQNLVEQAGQLKRLLVSLQLAADRREQSEKNLRQRLEKEIEQLRLGVRQVSVWCESGLEDLKQLLNVD